MSSAEALTLFLGGDVMTGRGIDQVLPHPSAPALREPYVRDARDYVELAERTPLRRRRFRLWRAEAPDARWLADTLHSLSLRAGVRVGLAADGALELRWTRQG